MFQIKNQIKQKAKWLSILSEYWTLSTVLCLALALSGCMGVYEGGFECSPAKGVGCKSISEVNEMVNQWSVSSIQYSVPAAQNPVSSVQYSECRDPMDIWYSPWFRNSQKNFRRNLDFQDPKTSRTREKVDASDSI